MNRKLVGLGILVSFLACAGCGAGGSDDSKRVKRPQARGELPPDRRSAKIVATALVADQVLRFPDPDNNHQKPWLEYSTNGDNIKGGSAQYRIPGDAYSKYYDVISYSGDGDSDTSVYNDKNKSIGFLGNYADIVGVRKSSKNITIFAYFDAGNDDQGDYESLGSYQIGQIENGQVRHYACFVDRTVLERVAGRHFKSDEERQAAATEFDLQIMDLLTSAEPALERDHCKFIAPYGG